MKKRALLFSGQGAQTVGMGRDLDERSAAARALYEQADAALGFPLRALSFDGPEEKLTDTSVCQPALYVHGLALLAVIREAQPDFTFHAAAGLSLGEYTAHAAAATFDFGAGLRLVHARGRLMREACGKTRGGMLALIGASPEAARDLAAAAGLDAANFNCPGQVVLSGPLELIPKAVELARARGIKRAIPLKVAGAYHSRLMRSAQEGLQPCLDQTAFSTPQAPVVANVTARVPSGPEAIKAALAEQVCGSVLWEESIRHLLSLGIEQLVELGPGGVLAGFCKRIDGAIPCLSIGTYAEYQEQADALRE